MKMLFGMNCELLVTHDLSFLLNRLTALNKAGIKYNVKSVTLGHATRKDGLIGAIGESQLYSSLYYVYVSKRDLNVAMKVCKNT